MDTEKLYHCERCKAEYKLVPRVWVGKTICHKCALLEREHVAAKYSGVMTIVHVVIAAIVIAVGVSALTDCNSGSYKQKELNPRSY